MAKVLDFKRVADRAASLPTGFRPEQETPSTQEDLIARLLNGIEGEKPLKGSSLPAALTRPGYATYAPPATTPRISFKVSLRDVSFKPFGIDRKSK